MMPMEMRRKARDVEKSKTFTALQPRRRSFQNMLEQVGSRRRDAPGAGAVLTPPAAG
jgi:hypothetical protein